MTIPTIRNHLQARPEALGDARRRFYGIYALVRHALPVETSHEEVCGLLCDLALATYTDAHRHEESIKRLWHGHESDPQRRRYPGR